MAVAMLLPRRRRVKMAGKEHAMIQPTHEQVQAIQGAEPLPMKVDPDTGEEFVLLRQREGKHSTTDITDNTDKYKHMVIKCICIHPCYQ